MRSFCKGIKLRAADSRPYESERPSFSVGADALIGPRGGTFVLQTRPSDYEGRDVYRRYSKSSIKQCTANRIVYTIFAVYF